MDILGFAKSHPLWIAGGIFIVGLLFLMGRGGGGGSGDGGMGAFYAAQNASKVSGDQVAIAQIQANAQTSIATGYFGSQKDINTIWASNQLASTQIQAQTAKDLAPYQVKAAYLQTVQQVASQPVQTTTSTKSSSGFFGIGAKSKTTTSVIPNPAWDMLSHIGDFFDDFAFPSG
ncbi:MAG: hypothetical protein IPK79_01390 [Vampirovibrionales bacterium]|nr:hypothetical protein [Vampirovibrionales bacterium]